MFPTFFFHKMREVASVLQIVKGKVSGKTKERVKGVDNALNAMDDERKVYEKEKRDAFQAKTPDMIDRPANQDISAI